MIIFGHELKRSLRSTLIWGLIIGGTIMLCVFLFPELKKELGDMVDAMSDLGGFGAAFGMDRLNYGDITGFYGIYAGSMLGIGGIFYAAILGTGLLAKEEKDHTADFLLTHPVTRTSVFWQKAAAMAVQILLMNLAVILLAWISIRWIGESPDWEGLCLFHLAQVLMQLEIGGICLGISAFFKKREYQHRHRRGGLSVFPGASGKYYGKGGGGQVYHTLRLRRRRKDPAGVRPGWDADPAGPLLWRGRHPGRVSLVQEEGYQIKLYRIHKNVKQ